MEVGLSKKKKILKKKQTKKEIPASYFGWNLKGTIYFFGLIKA